MNVKLSWGERFLNWLPKTDLYIRGQRGKAYDKQRQLERKLVEDLRPLFEQLKQEAYAEGYQAAVDRADRCHLDL